MKKEPQVSDIVIIKNFCLQRKNARKGHARVVESKVGVIVKIEPRYSEMDFEFNEPDSGEFALPGKLTQTMCYYIATDAGYNDRFNWHTRNEIEVIDL